jgi:hypothetical protein
MFIRHSRQKRILRAVLLTLACLLIGSLIGIGVVVVNAASPWSGSHTIIIESGSPGVIHTLVLEYAIFPSLVTDAIYERNPSRGDVVELATTWYLPFDRVIYSTAGVRRYLYSDQNVAYLSLTYRF